MRKPVIIEEKGHKNGEYYVRKYSRGRFLGKASQIAFVFQLPPLSLYGSTDRDVWNYQGGFANCYEVTRVGTSETYAAKIIDKATLEKPKTKQKVCFVTR